MATKKTRTSQPDSTQHSSQQSGDNGLLMSFFTNQLKDIFYAEQVLVKALDDMKAAASTDELERAFEEHQEETQRHVTRLKKVFALLGMEPEGKKCEAMDGIVKEAQSVVNDTREGSMTRDAALIIAAQKAEHYEIASYGGLLQLAITMDNLRVASLLDKTLQEEEDADWKLTGIAEEHINLEAELESAQVELDDF